MVEFDFLYLAYHWDFTTKKPLCLYIQQASGVPFLYLLLDDFTDHVFIIQGLWPRYGVLSTGTLSTPCQLYRHRIGCAIIFIWVRLYGAAFVQSVVSKRTWQVHRWLDKGVLFDRFIFYDDLAHSLVRLSLWLPWPRWVSSATTITLSLTKLLYPLVWYLNTWPYIIDFFSGNALDKKNPFGFPSGFRVYLKLCKNKVPAWQNHFCDCWRRYSHAILRKIIKKRWPHGMSSDIKLLSHDLHNHASSGKVVVTTAKLSDIVGLEISKQGCWVHVSRTRTSFQILSSYQMSSRKGQNTP